LPSRAQKSKPTERIVNAVVPILLMILAALAVSLGLLAAGYVIGPRRKGAVKQMPYESGMDPIHDARRRFDVRFYLVAIAFLIFDVELLFLYPWAVSRTHGADATVNHVTTDAGLRPKVIRMVFSDASAGVIEQTESAMNEEIAARMMLIFGEVMVFIGLLALSLVYAWRKGVFQWR
jgi:NADH-quinone oxidoreductase subunit A